MANTLSDAGNTPSGYGNLGNGPLSFVHEAKGTAVANDSTGAALVIDTDTGTVINYALCEAIGATLIVDSPVP